MGLKALQGTFGLQELVRSELLVSIALILQLGLITNVVLAFFNLIPVPPLDGGWILGGVLPISLARVFNRVRPYGFLLLILLLYTGVFGAILRPVMTFVRFWLLKFDLKHEEEGF